MRNLLVGVAFLVIGGFVYVHNTHTDAIEGKILMGAFGGPLGETGTTAVLLGLGVFFLLLGSFRWFWNHRAALAMEDYLAGPIPEVPPPKALEGDTDSAPVG